MYRSCASEGVCRYGKWPGGPKLVVCSWCTARILARWRRRCPVRHPDCTPASDCTVSDCTRAASVSVGLHDPRVALSGLGGLGGRGGAEHATRRVRVEFGLAGRCGQNAASAEDPPGPGRRRGRRVTETMVSQRRGGRPVAEAGGN